MQEQARQNMVLFERAFSVFAPFAKPEESQACEKPAQPKPGTANAATSAEIAELRAQLSAVQAQLERLSKSGASRGEEA